MRITGITRRIDPLGRVVIPSEVREMMGMRPGETVEFYVGTDYVGIKRHTPHCIFCGSIDEVIVFKDMPICTKCVGELNE